MPRVTLDERLAAAASFVRRDVKIADIGTDHAMLPVWLVQHGAVDVIAADINENPLRFARETIEYYKAEGVSLVVSDGLKSIPPVDDVIVAGMGGELIADIVCGCNFLDRRPHFILQPMTRDFVLRRRLYAEGFEILREKTAVAGGKTYTVMLCIYTGRRCEISEGFAFLGKNRDERYLAKQLSTLHKMGRGDEKYESLAQEITASQGKRTCKMTTVNDVYRFLDSLAPFSAQDKYDNSGFLVGDKNDEVMKIAVCLDITNTVIEEAADLGANLIISHHPVIFNPLKEVYAESPVYNLIKRNISAICAHTNLDVATGGVSDVMVDLLDFSGDEVFEISDEKSGKGYGRVVTLDFVSEAAELAEICKRVFNCSAVRYCDNGRVLKRIAVVSGSGGSEENIKRCAEKNIDAIITGDVKWSAAVTAKNLGVAVIDAGHFHTENVVCSVLVSKLSQEFDTEVFIPYSNGDLFRYI